MLYLLYICIRWQICQSFSTGSSSPPFLLNFLSTLLPLSWFLRLIKAFYKWNWQTFNIIIHLRSKHSLCYTVHLISLLLLITCRLQYPVFSTVGLPPPETSTAVTMQANPSYIAVDELEPNLCYSTVQTSSAYETISGEDRTLVNSDVWTLLLSVLNQWSMWHTMHL